MRNSMLINRLYVKAIDENRYPWRFGILYVAMRTITYVKHYVMLRLRYV